MRRLALLGVALLLAGCGGGSENGDIPMVEGFVPRLEAQGVNPTAPQPEPPGVLEVRSTGYGVPGGELHVFTFPDEQAAKTASVRVQPDFSLHDVIQDRLVARREEDIAGRERYLARYSGKVEQLTDGRAREERILAQEQHLVERLQRYRPRRGHRALRRHV